jgi:atypical dual specificity phosphatase
MQQAVSLVFRALAVLWGVGLVLFYYELVLPDKLARWYGRVWHYSSLPLLMTADALSLLGNRFDVVADGVLLGAMPLSKDFDALVQRKVRGIVNMCDEFDGHMALYATHGVEQLHLPTIDHREPSVADLTRAVAFIQTHLQAGNAVLVHCRAGIGRSAAVVFCWLVRHGGYSPEAAQRHLLECRPRVRRGLLRQPRVLEYLKRTCPAAPAPSWPQ